MKGQYRADSGQKAVKSAQLAAPKGFFARARVFWRLPNLFAVLFALYFASSLVGCAPGEGSSTARETSPAPSQRTLRVAISGDYLPFSHWPDQDGEPGGFSTELVQAFAHSRGQEIEWIRFRWSELSRDLDAKRFDVAISGITIRPDRSLIGRFSIPLATSQAVVLVREDSPARRAPDLDRPGIRLAVNRGGHLERVARRLFGAATIEPVDRNRDVLGKLEDARTDGVVTDNLEAPHWQARRAGLRRIGPLTEDRKAALFHPEEEELAVAFDTWLLDAEASGRLAVLRKRHGLAPDATATSQAALLAALDERLALMPAVARAKAILDIPIEDRLREERVLEAAWRGVAESAGAGDRKPASKEAVIELFRAQIEAAKWIQEAVSIHAAQAPRSDTEKRRARRDLDETIRPALIRLGNQITRLLLRARAEDGSAPSEATLRRALLRHALPDEHLGAIHAGLVRTLQTAE